MCLPVLVTQPSLLLEEGEYKGFEWVVIHNGMGHRCGYIKLNPDHPWYGQNYDVIEADCHGCLTFSEHDQPCDKPGNDDGYWIGFDCGHYDDAIDFSLPGVHQDEKLKQIFSKSNRTDGTIKTTEFVKAECYNLIDQASTV